MQISQDSNMSLLASCFKRGKRWKNRKKNCHDSTSNFDFHIVNVKAKERKFETIKVTTAVRVGEMSLDKFFFYLLNSCQAILKIKGICRSTHFFKVRESEKSSHDLIGNFIFHSRTVSNKEKNYMLLIIHLLWH